MKVLETVAAMQAFRSAFSGGSLGLVPTMGALHTGHLSLVRRSQAENSGTVVSIFVNPTQFDQATDLEKYPHQFEHDIEMLEELGVEAVFTPDYQTLYPDDFHYRVSETELSRRLCGAHRPGHFEGVLTVVMKLLNIVRPDNAYFGEKDYQQLLLVRGMTRAFFMPVNIVPCPIVREKDGLAMSSRNRRLDAVQRRKAPALFRTLKTADSAESARRELEQLGFAVDYVEEFQGRRLAAASLGATRLIDNVPVNNIPVD
jgi:pantoate--beta-alanine ligase